MSNSALPSFAGSVRRLPHLAAHHTLLRCIDRRGARWSFFDARDISRIWVHDKHVRFLVMGRHGPSERWLDESLERLAERLQPLGFVRVHRQELINLRFLRAVSRGHRRRHLSLELTDGQRAPVSRRLAPNLRRTLARLLAWPPPAAAAEPDLCFLS